MTRIWCQAESQKLQSALDQMESKLKNLGAECWRFGREVGRDTPTMEVYCSLIRKWPNGFASLDVC